MIETPNENDPIGFFDSGLGGLTVAAAVHKLLPQENLLYYGDSAYVPYGDKSRDVIRERIKTVTEWLIQRRCKTIVVACNSAVAAGIDIVKKIAGERIVVDTIAPAMTLLTDFPDDIHLGVIGTKLTIGSDIYPRALLASKPNARCSTLATPLLEILVEAGEKDLPVTREAIATYLSDKKLAGIDALLLGCTHYPLLQSIIENHYQGKTDVINTSEAIALEVKRKLSDASLLRTDTTPPIQQFFTSEFNPHFNAQAQLFFGEQINFERA